MHFLVDAQLPPALARWLAVAGHEARHVADVDLASASDRQIWQYALDVGAIVISKDEDFVILRSLKSSGPAIVWIRRGNTSRRQLLTWFETLMPQLLAALERGEELVEIV